MAVDGLAGSKARRAGRAFEARAPEPPNRYERHRPGELIHIDVKTLGRILRPGHRVTGDRRSQTAKTYTPDGRRIGDAGWEFVHVAIDDHSRLAYAEVLIDEKATTATGFLQRAIEFFAGYGITVERVMTDNGVPYPEPPRSGPAAHFVLPAALRPLMPTTQPVSCVFPPFC